MGKKRINKIVGRISHEVANQYDLQEYENQEIVQLLDLYQHIHKHISEFATIDNYNNAIFNIESIIKNPYFVNYEKDRNSLLYYKEIDEFVCVVVKLNLRKNKDNYVSTIYPISKTKIEKIKEKNLIEKYTYTGNF